jgi:hypothetical protein
MLKQNAGKRNEAEIVKILRECCASGTPALALPIDTGMPCRALFLEVTSDELILATASESMESNFYALCPCLVSFNHVERVMAFLSQIRDWNHGETPPRLVLDLPANLVTMEHRRHFRVPLRGDHALEVKVETGNGQTWTATPVDISVAGMLVEFSEEPDLAIDTGLSVELRRNAETARVRGIVRHHRHRRYGVFFPRGADLDGDGVPAPLRRIVGGLEEHWLRVGGPEAPCKDD